MAKRERIDETTGEIVPVTSASTTSEAPEWITGTSSEGLEAVDREDLVLPRIKLLQGLSPEVKARAGSPGEMMNSLTGESYGDRLEIVPVRYWRERRYWRPRTDGGGILCQSPDGKLKVMGGIGGAACASCEFSSWRSAEAAGPKGETSPLCSLYMNFACLVAGAPVCWSCERTKLKSARQLIGLAKYSGEGKPLYSRRYEITAIEAKSSGGEYFTFAVRPLGWVDRDTYQAAETLYHSMQDRPVVVDTEDVEPDGEEF